MTFEVKSSFKIEGKDFRVTLESGKENYFDSKEVENNLIEANKSLTEALQKTDSTDSDITDKQDALEKARDDYEDHPTMVATRMTRSIFVR